MDELITRPAAVLHNLAIVGVGCRIVVMELVMAETRTDLASATVDMQMFVCTRGRERILKQWRKLFDQCDLVLEEVVSLQSFAKNTGVAVEIIRF